MKHFFASRFLPYFLLAILTPFTANAGSVYKWTDEYGVVHYGDKKPANAESKELRVKAGRGSSGNASMTDNSSKESQKSENASGDTKLSEEQKKNRDTACKRAKDNLATIKTYARIKTKDENGEYRFLSPEEKSQKEAEAQKFVNENCK